MTTIAAARVPRGPLFAGPPRYVPQSPWPALPAVLVTMAACLAALLVGAVVLVALLLGADTPQSMAEPNLDRVFSLGSASGVSIAIATQLVSLSIIWWAAGYKNMRGEVLRLLAPVPGAVTLLLGALGLLTATGVLEYVMYLASGFDIFADSRWLREGLSSPYWWGTLVIGVVLAPLWEELTFRGFLLSALAKTRAGFWGAGIISNVLWMLLHWGYSWQGLASVFFAGLVLTWIMWRTGSIWACIAAHGLSNAAALAFVYAFSPA